MFKPSSNTFTTPIRIQHRTETLINGAPKPTWADATDPIAYCNWKGKGGTETLNAGILSVLDTADLTMWYRNDISETDRILKDNDTTQAYEVMNVENVEERGMYLIVKVKRVKAT